MIRAHIGDLAHLGRALSLSGVDKSKGEERGRILLLLEEKGASAQSFHLNPDFCTDYTIFAIPFPLLLR